jgi:SPX domain protein involved in polyphosphate accumulation
MKDQMIFKRYEIKYMISAKQLAIIKEAFKEHMIADVHGKSTICSLYYDTPDFRLIRRSLEKPVYKEKLRVRSYGVSNPDSLVFVELKKKYKSVVYKRRISLPEKDATEYLSTGVAKSQSQITNEIDYALKFYHPLVPSMLLSYDREAYYGKDNHEFRITFDSNVLWRDYDLSLCKGIYGNEILQPDQIIMEVKTADAIPLWLVKLLSEHHIYKTSFSKYGTAYQTLWAQQHKHVL